MRQAIDAQPPERPWSCLIQTPKRAPAGEGYRRSGRPREAGQATRHDFILRAGRLHPLEQLAQFHHLARTDRAERREHVAADPPVRQPFAAELPQRYSAALKAPRECRGAICTALLAPGCSLRRAERAVPPFLSSALVAAGTTSSTRAVNPACSALRRPPSPPSATSANRPTTPEVETVRVRVDDPSPRPLVSCCRGGQVVGRRGRPFLPLVV